MSFIRTVLGDIDPADLGVTYSHEHLVIDGGRPIQLFPDFRLDSVEDAVAELAPAKALGLRAVVDAMPADCGRNATKLAAVSRASGIHVVAPTGAPPRALLPRPPLERRPRRRRDRGALRRRRRGRDRRARLRRPGDPPNAAPGGRRQGGSRQGSPRADRGEGIRRGSGGPRPHRRPDPDPLRRRHRGTNPGPLPHRTGRPAGQRRPVPHGQGRRPRPTSARSLRRVRWSSTTRASAGGRARRTGRLTLLAWAFEDGFGDRVVLGMDAARRGYWTVHGGTPGMAWLLGPFAAAMAARGIGAAGAGPPLRRQPGPGVRVRPRPTPLNVRQPRSHCRDAARHPHERRRIPCPSLAGSSPRWQPRPAARWGRTTSGRRSTMPSTRRSATRSRPGST